VLGPNTDPLVGIDGKTLKHSGVHLAGAIGLSPHRCLGVEPVAVKSNEIPATQKLIGRAPILPSQMVSLDAMNTKHHTVAQILFDEGPTICCRSKATKTLCSRPPPHSCRRAFPPQVQRTNYRGGRKEYRALVARTIEPKELGLAGAVQIARIDRQIGAKGQLTRTWLVLVTA